MNGANIIVEAILDFAVRIVNLYKYLCLEHNEFVLSKQLLRSGTSIGANIVEAQGAQSISDFIAKLHISLKECRESEYWLKLLFRTNYLMEKEYKSINTDIDKVIGILVNILKSAKNKAQH